MIILVCFSPVTRSSQLTFFAIATLFTMTIIFIFDDVWIRVFSITVYIKRESSIENMPVCIGCDDDLPADHFNQKSSRCRPCQKKYKAENYLKNKAIIQAKQKEYREENAEKLKASKKEYRDNNKEKVALSKKNYKIANRLKENLRKKAFARKKYEPTKWLTAHKNKYSHVLKEILLELNFKACPGCKKRYNMRHFQHKHTGKETSTCQTCREKRNSSERTHAKAEAYKKLHREVLAPYIHDLKVQGHCVDCGEEDDRALDFDHVDPATKTRAVSHCRSMTLIKAEVAKCVLRCCVCHLHQNTEGHRS